MDFIYNIWVLGHKSQQSGSDRRRWMASAIEKDNEHGERRAFSSRFLYFYFLSSFSSVIYRYEKEFYKRTSDAQQKRRKNPPSHEAISNA